MAYNRTIYSKGTKTYQDFDMSFKANPTTGDLRVKTDVDAIKQSVKNLLLLNYGDIPYKPLFGSNIYSQLFEQLTPITTNLLETSIRSTLKAEPRIEILELNITTPENEPNSLNISLVVNILNIATPVDIVTIIKRTR